MKKVLFAFLCAAWVISCEMPQSLTVKANPELALSLGSPFANLAPDERIENQISSQKIKEMMSSDDNSVSIYDYQGDNSSVQTYLLHYPIMNMNLDLKEYVGDAMKMDNGQNQSFSIPAAIGNINSGEFTAAFPDGLYVTNNLSSLDPNALGAYSNTPAPLFTISLADMRKLITEVNGAQFAIQLNYDPALAGALGIWIKAFDIGDEFAYASGNQSGSKLVFDGNKKIIIPKDDLGSNGELYIYAKITEPCVGTIDPEMIFEWTNAKVNTSDDPLAGDYSISNSLGKFLGGDATFKSVEGYIFVNGISTNATMDLSNSGSPIFSSKPLTNKDPPQFPSSSSPFTETINEHSLNDPIDLAGIFAASSAKLEYQIMIPGWTITRNEIESGGGEKVVTADLLIILPLDFAVRSDFSDTGYMKMGLGDGLFSSETNGDLLGRTDSDSDDLFSQIEWVEIVLKNININIIDKNKLALLLTATNYNGILPLNRPVLRITMEDIPYPFEPQFEILLEKDADENFGTLAIQRASEPSFDFFISISLKAGIEQTITF